MNDNRRLVRYGIRAVLSLVMLTCGSWLLLGLARADVEAPHAVKGEHAAAGHEGAHEHDPFEHVQDAQDEWVFFESLGISLPLRGLSKFMIIELIAAGLVLAIYIPLARRMQTGEPPKGAWDNAFESVLTFIREDIAKPNFGEHDADHFVPFLWTLFLFILFNNLLGMIPFLGSPTANLYVTGALAITIFLLLHGVPIAKMGLGHYLESQWPHIEIGHNTFARLFGLFLCVMIFAIEMMGSVIKCGVLAVRLFANMFAGHTVLAMILSFIIVSFNAGVSAWLWGGITGASVLGVVALSLLELFVAFLQSYIFVFLTALFMGMALHPQH